jgi:hypothetical protein
MLPTTSLPNMSFSSSDPMAAIMGQLKEKRSLANKRENIALMARLELLTQKNKSLKDKFKRYESRKLQHKLAEMRLRDFKSANPPPVVALPFRQLPGKQFENFCLNGETDVYKFLSDYEGNFAAHEASLKQEKEEPRIVSKMLAKNFPPIEEEAKSLNAVSEMRRIKNLDKKTMLDDLALKQFDKSETVDRDEIVRLLLASIISLPTYQ